MGFLCSEGVLYQPSDLYDISIDEQEGLIHVKAANGEAEQRFMKRYITSCCGRGRSSFYFVNDAQSMSRVDTELTLLPSTFGIWPPSWRKNPRCLRKPAVYIMPPYVLRMK